MKNLINKRVAITWYDHYQLEDKNNEDAVMYPPIIFETCGRYIGHDKLHHVIAYNYKPEGDYNDYMKILKKATIKINILNVKKGMGNNISIRKFL